MSILTSCADVRRWIDAYADRELELKTSLEVESHLETCAACKQVYAGREALRSAIQDKLRYPAPVALRDRLAASIREETDSSKKQQSVGVPPLGAQTEISRHRFWPHLPAWTAWAAAACLLLIAFGSFVWLRSLRAEDLLAQQVIPAHIRSLQVSHLTDVLSSDQHTVKPWFTGKIDFSPVVVDLASDGFPLTGGRLDYVEGHNAAALVFQRRKHTINVFVWPGDEMHLRNLQAFSRQGFNLLFWSDNGLNYCAVSDVNATDLKELAERLRAAQ